MTKYDAAKLKELAMGLEMGTKILIWRALDEIENQKREVEGLIAMLEKANEHIDRLQIRAEGAWETNRTLMSTIDTISEERNAALKRIQELEVQRENLG